MKWFTVGYEGCDPKGSLGKQDVPVMKAFELLRSLENSQDFVELTPSLGIQIDLKYAGSDNFMKRNVYGDFNRAFLHRVAFEKFQKALAFLREKHPEYQFIIFDALRPRSVQWLLWNEVKDTPFQPYVADPIKGSIHNFGLALDLSLLNRERCLVDMGTEFDSFTPLSQPKLEDQFLAEGRLQESHLRNRKILRAAMEAGGFAPLPHEWWHFNAATFSEAAAAFQIIE